ncbi:uncharacterized protein LOC133921454 isoform X2 [Phragmites australis]|uniref:uncharacterized protein LOC133921454 isoform X2 n=1 Tax=Phragmites australis TaxID=29695 RepID=UPI002D7925ED|nr:uncharacterized protein LOC133921454 isoform X2 [Phragmites australis]
MPDDEGSEGGCVGVAAPASCGINGREGKSRRLDEVTKPLGHRSHAHPTFLPHFVDRCNYGDLDCGPFRSGRDARIRSMMDWATGRGTSQHQLFCALWELYYNDKFNEE